MTLLNRSLLGILAAAAVVCLGLIILFALLPGPDERFSEFYMLDEHGNPCNYPAQACSGQPVALIVGIVNHESGPSRYEVRIVSDGAIIRTLDAGTLDRGRRWEKKTDFVVSTPGDDRLIELYLFKDGDGSPCIRQPLTLRLDVK